MIFSATPLLSTQTVVLRALLDYNRRSNLMPFQFPDPSVSTKATLPNGEEWEYVNGAWQAVSAADDDQQQIDDLKERVTSVEQN